MTMIPERYRAKLPPYWRENNVAIYHFEAAAGEIDFQKARKEDLDRQMNIKTATWGLVYWEYIFKVTPKLGDSYDIRRARVVAKYLKRNPFTPAMAAEITKLFIAPEGRDKIIVSEDPDTGFFYISTPLASVYDIESWVQDIRKRKRVPHTFVPQLSCVSTLEVQETITVNLKRYHTVSEFNVGMTPLKYKSEVTL